MKSNKLSLLQNELEELDLKHPFGPKEFRNFPMGLKKIVSLGTKELTYGQSHVFEIPSGVGYLAKITLKYTFSSNLTTSKVFMAKRICKFIYLETRRGSRTIHAIRPEYVTARIDSASTDVTSFYDNTMSLFGSSPYTCYNQLFLNLSEDPSKFIDLNTIEKLQLRVVIADNYTAMGIDTDITNLVIEPFIEVFECDVNPIPVKTFLSYDVYYESPKLLTNSSTSSTFDIHCNKNVYNIHLLIKNESQNYVPINEFTLRSSDQEIVRFQREFSYDPWTRESNLEINNSLSYWFSMYRSRSDNTFMLNLDYLRPLKLEIEHDTVPDTDYYLYVFFEYPVLSKIENGIYERMF